MRTSTFESSVNSYGGKTANSSADTSRRFESSVNSYGGKTLIVAIPQMI